MTHLTSPDRPRSQSMEAHKYLPTALALIFCANAACAGAQSLPASAWREPIAEVDGANANILHLPVITVSDKAETERADGPVHGYRATRSSTFTKIDMPLREVPASVTVVPAMLMKDQAMQSLADVFRYVPGVLAHQGEGNRDQVILRGNSTTADFYVNGIRDDAQVFRDLYNLERVEVLKGPGGMIFGRGGAGGVVNRVTKQPVFEAIAAATLTLGSWAQRRMTFDVGSPAGSAGGTHAAWRINAMDERGSGFRNGFDLKRNAINPALTWIASDATQWTVGYEHQHDTRTADRGIPSQAGRPYETDRALFFGNAAQSRARSTFDSAYSIVDHDFGSDWQIKNNLRVTYYDKFYQNVYPGSAVNGAGNLTLSAYNNANVRTNVFNQTDLTGHVTTGSMVHVLLAGIEVGHQRSDS